MNLNSLVKTEQIKAQRPNASEVQRLFTAAKRNLTDAEAAGISDETRFDADEWLRRNHATLIDRT